MVDSSESDFEISFYESIFKNAQESITITDLNGNLLLANPSALELFEYTFDEIRQMKLDDIYEVPEDCEVMISKMKKTGLLKDFSAKFITKSGKSLELIVNFFPIYNTNRELYAIQSNFINKKAIVQASQTLLESEERYRILVEHAPEAITVLDVDLMRFHDVNLKALEFFKMTREQLLNKSPVDVTPPYLANGERSDVVAMQKIEEAVNGGKPIFDWLHIDANGNVIPCQVQLIRLPHSEKVLVRGSIIDMTDKIEAEQKLKKSQMELAQAQKMEALGRLAGGIAHDFNNTLTAILGYCELLKIELNGDHELVELVNEIAKAGNKSTHLVKQLLTFSRKEEPQKQPVDVNYIIKETSNLLRNLIGEDILVEINLDENIGLIKAHPTHITQILMNLVINAREAMPQGGVLRIRTHNYMLMKDNGRMSRSVFLYVSDTGIGMSEELKSQIFEPFFTTKITGTGLGLSTVYGIVEELDGTIKVDSRPNEGTTFQLSFPVVNEIINVDDETEVSTHDPSILRDKSVLIVEDDEDVKNLVVRLLVEFGMDVNSTSSPKQAIETVFHESFDIIISDMIMPELNGIEMIMSIRKRFPELRVLFITGYMNQPQLEQVMEKGFPVLYKPFTRDALSNMVSQIFIDNV